MPESARAHRSHPALWALTGLLLAGMGVLRFVRARNEDETVSYAIGAAIGTILGALLLASLIAVVWRKLRRTGRSGITPGVLALAAAIALVVALAQAGERVVDGNAAFERGAERCTEPADPLFTSPPARLRFAEPDAQTRTQTLANLPAAAQEHAVVRSVVGPRDGIRAVVVAFPLGEGEDDTEDAVAGFIEGATERGAESRRQQIGEHPIGLAVAPDGSATALGVRGCHAATVLSFDEDLTVEVLRGVLGA